MAIMGTMTAIIGTTGVGISPKEPAGIMTAIIGTIGVGISPKEPAGIMTAIIGTIGSGVSSIEANRTVMAAPDWHLTGYGYSLALIGGIFPIHQVTCIAREHIL